MSPREFLFNGWVSTLTQAILYATIGGCTIPVGGWLASREAVIPGWMVTELRHSVIAFGGGALLSAIALVLVPTGMEHLSLIPVLLCFLGGGLVFCGLDMLLARSGGSAAQLMAMLLDFVPEAMALGAMLSGARDKALLLALLIALQNAPEGFNAYREIMQTARMRSLPLLGIFSLLVLLGPAAALAGQLFLVDHPAVLGGMMLFASGGILYLIFQDIAPQVKLQRRWGPPLGAVLGFLLGLVGEKLLSS